jgi:hypothetical protein
VIPALARLPLARLIRSPRAWITSGAWCSLGVAVALAARSQGSAHGADHVLVDAYGALLLPVLAYALVGAVVGARSMSASTAPLVAFGASPARAAGVAIAVAALACALVAGALAALIALIAHGVADPPRARDAVTSAYAGALGGAAYASWFALGAGLGRRGGGRAVLLVVDWLFGAGGGAAGLGTPRAHLRNLLGGAAPMGLSEHASAIAMASMVVVYGVVATRRARE